MSWVLLVTICEKEGIVCIESDTLSTFSNLIEIGSGLTFFKGASECWFVCPLSKPLRGLLAGLSETVLKKSKGQSGTNFVKRLDTSGVFEV